jgi:hypothetical protein
MLFRCRERCQRDDQDRQFKKPGSHGYLSICPRGDKQGAIHFTSSSRVRHREQCKARFLRRACGKLRPDGKVEAGRLRPATLLALGRQAMYRRGRHQVIKRFPHV